jgi:aquaporin Z
MAFYFKSIRNVAVNHWPEYLMEAAGLGLFMVSACFFSTLLEHTSSPLRQVIVDPFVRRLLMGLAMGATAVGIIYSPWGQRSGAHINPAVTLTFLRLGKVNPTDAVYYVLAQFLGGLAGVLLMVALMGQFLAAPTVNYVATVPGAWGMTVAFIAELVISFGLMFTVLTASNHRKLTRFTGLFAGVLVATYITFEAPISGMSMNPARTFGSAFSANLWTALWLYFTAPVLGMLLAAEVYLKWRGTHAVFCAKLNHFGNARCIFHCHYHDHDMPAPNEPEETSRSVLAL